MLYHGNTIPKDSELHPVAIVQADDPMCVVDEYVKSPQKVEAEYPPYLGVDGSNLIEML